MFGADAVEPVAAHGAEVEPLAFAIDDEWVDAALWVGDGAVETFGDLGLVIDE